MDLGMGSGLGLNNPPTPLNDLAGDVAFQWEMGIKAIDALATLLEPMF